MLPLIIFPKNFIYFKDFNITFFATLFYNVKVKSKKSYIFNSVDLERYITKYATGVR
jgi:hypothetical protein